MQAEGFEKGAQLLAVGPTTGAVRFEAGEIYENDAPVEKALKGASVTIRVPEKVRENDKLYVLEPRR